MSDYGRETVSAPPPETPERVWGLVQRFQVDNPARPPLADGEVMMRGEGVNVPAPFFLASNVNWHIPDHVVVSTGDQSAEVEFSDIPETGSTLASQSMSKFQIDFTRTRVVHDFTFEVLTTSLDCSYSGTFGRTRDGYDNLTPDWLWVTPDGRAVLLEFTTTNSNSESVFKRAFDEKRAKYLYSFDQRTKNHLQALYGVIVVGSTRVFTNLPLSTDEVNVLCWRFRTALEIHKKAPGLRRPGDLFDYRETRLRDVKAKFENIGLDFKTQTFPEYTRELYETAFESPDITKVKTAMLHASIEADRELTKSSFCLGQDLSDQARHKLSQEQTQKLIEDYLDERDRKDEQENDGDPLYYSTKAIIGLPYWVLLNGTGSTSVKNTEEDNMWGLRELGRMTGDPTLTAFSEAFNSVTFDSDAIMEEKVESERKRALEELTDIEEEALEYKRRHYRRVKIELSERDRRELAKVGIDGKKYTEDVMVKQHQKSKKRAMSHHMDTADIDQFVNSAQKLFYPERPDQNESLYSEQVKKLAKRAYDIHEEGCGLYVEGFVAEYNSSPIGRWTDFVSNLGLELAAALAQNCGRDEYVLKKLRNWDVYVLIKPTKMSEHLFFSLLTWNSSFKGTHRDPVGDVFKKTRTNGTVSWTDFHSVKAAKLTNWIGCQSQMLALLGHWLDQLGGYFGDAQLSSVTDKIVCETWKMYAVNLMILLEDKARSEEMITMSRFVFMEGFVGPPCFPNPAKMLSKMPDVLRSRFQVWIHKKLLQAMTRINALPFAAVMEERTMKWQNMFDLFTGELVADKSILISSFYLGYLKNKDEGAEGNGSSKMYPKIISPELLKRFNTGNYGENDPDPWDMEFLEVHKSFCLHTMSHALEVLEKVHGKGVHELITLRILEKFAELDLESVGTLKASSTFNSSMYRDDPKFVYKRRKAIEGVREYIDRASYVFEIMQECLEAVEKAGAMHICLFKKSQHGGLREIYVLGFKERIVQLGLETISKAICELFDSETLMHPESKAKIPGEHARAAREICGEDFGTICVAADARQWNQGHNVTKFAVMLCKFTEKLFHGFIMRGCAMFNRKNIRIDSKTLAVFRKQRDTPLSNPILEKMRQRYWGDLEDDSIVWMDIGASYIKTTSGMMQGILHYTSSLWHTLHQEHLKDFARQKMIAGMGLQTSKKSVHVSVMQSSDDSAMMISFPRSDPDTDKKAQCTAAFVFEYKKSSGKLMGIYSSEKTTANLPFIVEFNSEFYFHRDLIRPSFRWIAAVTTMSEADSMAARMEEMYGNLSNTLSGGSTFSVTAICQYAQLMLHYRTLGGGVSGLFQEFCDHLIDCPDPALGFFLMDHPLLAGLPGFKYNLYQAVKNTNLGKKYKASLDAQDPLNEKRIELGMNTKTLEVTSAGTLTHSTCVTHGSRDKWSTLVRKLDLPEDWEDHIQANPICIFAQTDDPKDKMARLAAKMRSPGVIASLGKANAVVRIVASSVYILSRRIVVDKAEWYVCDVGNPPKKRSLLKTVVDQRELIKDSDQIEMDQLEVLFPYSHEYDRMSDLLTSFAESEIEPIVRTHRISTTIEVTGTGDPPPVSANTVAAYMWFHIPPRGAIAGSVLREEWDLLKQRILWLRDSFEETLAASPFCSAITLKTFLLNLHPRSRNVVISGAPIRKVGGLSNLATTISGHHSTAVKLSNDVDTVARDNTINAMDVKHCLYLALTGGFTQERKTEICTTILQNAPDITEVRTSRLSRRNTLRIMQMVARGGRPTDIMTAIKRNKQGIIGGYTVRQRIMRDSAGKARYVGYGCWSGLVDDVPVSIHFHCAGPSHPNQLTKVIMKDTSVYKLVLGLVKQVCKDAGIINSQDVRVETYPTCPPRTYSEYLFKRVKAFCFRPGRSLDGAPMNVDPNLEWTFTSEGVRNMFMWAQGKTLSIRFQNDAAHQRPEEAVTMLSYFPRSTDLLLSETSQAVKLIRKCKLTAEPSNSWFCAKTLPPITINTIAKALAEGRAPSGYDLTAFREQIKTCFENSVMKYGISVTGTGALRGSFSPNTSVSGETDLTLVHSFMRGSQREVPLSALGEEILNAQRLPSVNEIIESSPTILSFEQLNVGGLLECSVPGDFGQSDRFTELEAVQYQHTLFDSYVRNVALGRERQFQRLINKREYSIVTEDVAWTICSLRGEDFGTYVKVALSESADATGEVVTTTEKLG
nr:MAG: RNA-dependent RNA polymerase [Timbillica virus]